MAGFRHFKPIPSQLTVEFPEENVEWYAQFDVDPMGDTMLYFLLVDGAEVHIEQLLSFIRGKGYPVYQVKVETSSVVVSKRSKVSQQDERTVVLLSALGYPALAHWFDVEIPAVEMTQEMARIVEDLLARQPFVPERIFEHFR